MHTQILLTKGDNNVAQVTEEQHNLTPLNALYMNCNARPRYLPGLLKLIISTVLPDSINICLIGLLLPDNHICYLRGMRRDGELTNFYNIYL